MSTAAKPLPPSEPPAPDKRQVVQDALDALLQMGLRVASVSTRLAEVELEAADAVAREAAQAAAVVRPQATLTSALEIGKLSDISEAVRDMAATRMALITTTFERASRTVRRTAALLLRAGEARPFHRAPGAGPVGEASPGEGRVRGPGETLYERLDAPEPDDEIGDRAAHEVLADIRRDLRQAATVEDVRLPEPDAAAPPPAGHAGQQRLPNQVARAPNWARQARGLPEPDE